MKLNLSLNPAVFDASQSMHSILLNQQCTTTSNFTSLLAAIVGANFYYLNFVHVLYLFMKLSACVTVDDRIECQTTVASRFRLF